MRQEGVTERYEGYRASITNEEGGVIQLEPHRLRH